MSDTSPADIAAMFARTAQELMACPDVQTTLDGIVEAAVAVVAGCEYAGVMIVRAGKVESPAISHALVADCHREQGASREGPCLEAAKAHEPVIVVDDLRTDPRWPRFGPAAARYGVRSMLACELSAGPREAAALNMYSSEPGAFDASSVELGHIFAMHAGMAMARAKLEAQLRAAVESRGGIGQAIGVLVERHRVTPEHAFEMLRVTSQNLNIRLRDLAERVVHTGVDPSDVET